MNKQTIVYVVNAKVPEEVRAEKICSFLAGSGHKVVMACKWSGESEIREQRDGYTIIRIGKGKGFMSTCFPGNPVWSSALSSILHEFNPQLIICREMIPAQACVKANNNNIPIILDMAEHYPAAMREWKKYNTNILSKLAVHQLRIPDAMEAFAVRNANAIITVCEEQNDRLHDQYNVPFESMFIVHNTPDEQTIASIRKGASIPPTIFGHHGYFTLERNLGMLVKGFDIAARNHSQIRLLLAGTGETFEDVRSVAKKCASFDRIEFTGSYLAKDLNELYGRTDIGILPYAEQQFRQYTLPNKAFDYMACGIPIISSGLKPMKRLLDQTGAGIYGNCETPQAIAYLIEAMLQSNVQEMSLNGVQAFREMYNWSQDCQRLLRAIESFQ